MKRVIVAILCTLGVVFLAEHAYVALNRPARQSPLVPARQLQIALLDWKAHYGSTATSENATIDDLLATSLIDQSFFSLFPGGLWEYSHANTNKSKDGNDIINGYYRDFYVSCPLNGMPQIKQYPPVTVK